MLAAVSRQITVDQQRRAALDTSRLRLAKSFRSCRPHIHRLIFCSECLTGASSLPADGHNLAPRPCASPAHPAPQPGSNIKPVSQPHSFLLHPSQPSHQLIHRQHTMSNVPSRTATPSRDTGSHTLQETQPNPVLRLNAPSGVLRLRAEPEERRHIHWAEDVVDNEGMGKKSSKGMHPCTNL